MTAPPRRPLHLLLVDDNPGDVRLVREALRSSGGKTRVSTATDGVEALEALRAAAPEDRPDLVLLDLNLPRLDGRETLRALRADPALRSLPTIIFSSSTAAADVEACLALGADAYVTKPADFEGFERELLRLESTWSDRRAS